MYLSCLKYLSLNSLKENMLLPAKGSPTSLPPTCYSKLTSLLTHPFSLNFLTVELDQVAYYLGIVSAIKYVTNYVTLAFHIKL